METGTDALARHVVSTAFADLPSEVVHEAKRRIADVIGAGLSGSTTPVGERIRKFAQKNTQAGTALIWGSDTRVAPAYAALANGTMAFHLELDDVHRTSHTHPGVTTIPAALALAEQNHLAGKDLLAAVVLGYDAQARVEWPSALRSMSIARISRREPWEYSARQPLRQNCSSLTRRRPAAR